MIVLEMSAAAMKAGLTPKASPPSLKSHREHVDRCERAVDRAELAVHNARQRLADAVAASQRAKEDMAEWVAANPDTEEEPKRRKRAKAAAAVPEVDVNQIEMFA